MHKIHYLS